MDFCQVDIKRQLKRAKLFEIQKLVKQIRMLENRKGTDVQLEKNQRKVTRLVDVLDAIKDLNLEVLATEVYQCMLEGSSIAGQSHTREQVPNDPTQRAKQRLLTNKILKRHISTTRDLKQDSTTAHSGTKHAVIPEHVKLLTECRSTSSTDEIRTIHKERCGTCDDESDSVGCGSVASTERGDEDGRLSTEGTELIDVTTIERRKPNATEDTRRRQRKVQRVSSPSRISAGSSRLGLESVFVGALSEDHPRTRQRKLSEESVKLKRNRPGQRTRQKQWEEMFGRKAKHVLKGKRTQKKRLQGKKKLVRKDGARNSKSTSSQSLRPQSSQQQQGLHPSWEAQRKKKSLEMGIPQFQGQRTVFCDSD